MNVNYERKAPCQGIALLLLCVTVATILLSSLAQRYLGHVMEDPNLDFYDYYFAAKVVRQNPHAALYQGATDGNPQLRSASADSPIAQVAREAGVEDTELYLYPPLFADMLRPLTYLSLPHAAQIWRVINLIAVLISALLMIRLLGLRFQSAECLLVIAMAYSFWPIHEAISLGQITLVLLALWSLGIAAYAGGMPILSAAAFALATSFKVTPLLLVPLFLVWKDWRWLLGYAGSLLVVLAAMLTWNGPAMLTSFAAVARGMGGILPALQNKCIGSVVGWMYYGRVFNLLSVHGVMNAAPNGLLLAIKLLDLAFYAACILLVWRRGNSASISHRVMTVALFALVTLLVAPVSWRHGYTVAVLPFAFLWAEALRMRARQSAMLWLLALSSISVGSLMFDLAAGGPVPQIVKVIFASAWPLSCALLCLVRLALKSADDSALEAAIVQQ